MQPTHFSTSCSICPSKNQGIFCSAHHEPLEKMSQEKHMMHFKKGDVIFLQGETLAGIFCIKSGSVKLIQSDNNGNEQIINIAGPGQTIGTRFFLCQVPFTHSVKALSEVQLCFIPAQDFQKILSTDISVGLKLAQTQAQEAILADKKNFELVNMSVQARTAELMLNLASNYGTPHAKGTLINLPLTRHELSSMIGATSESVIRTISDIKEMGILTQEGKLMIITNKEKLADLAQLHF